MVPAPGAGDYFGDHDWLDSAACRNYGRKFFSDDRHSQRIAIMLCRACPVVAECLSVAMDNREPSGVWGGLTPLERRRLAETAPAGRTWIEALQALQRAQPRRRRSRPPGPSSPT